MPVSATTTLIDAFRTTVARNPNSPALRSADGRTTLSWRQYATRAEEIAGGLAGLGVGHGDIVGLMLTNRPEFALIDTAAMHLGAAPFSIYNTSSPEQFAYLLEHSGAKVLVAEAVFLPTIKASGASIDQLVILDGPAEDGAIAFSSLPSHAPADFDFAAVSRAVEHTDLCTLIYTSGTTGTPKGVELTHANIIAEVQAFVAVTSARAGEKTISYLPSAHIADRLIGHYMPMVVGCEVTFVADPTTIATVLPAVQPNLWLGVPRIWEKIRFGVMEKLDNPPNAVVGALGSAAMSLATKKVRNGGELARFDSLIFGVLDKVVLAKIRAALGLDELRLGFSGAAPIAAETLQFFEALGIKIVEVWGLTETCAGTTINPPADSRIGTVGKPVPGVELILADDGEIKVRGPMVTRGYRNDPERTAEVIDADGWFSTGDIGVLDADGYLKIVDRKKDLIINASGKNMSPSHIENTIKTELPMVQSVVAIGDGRPYLVALVALDVPTATALVAKDGRTVEDPAALAKDPTVTAAVAAGVETANKRLSRAEQVKKYSIVPDAWAPGGNELTPTLKVRRAPVQQQYAAVIESLYTS